MYKNYKTMSFTETKITFPSGKVKTYPLPVKASEIAKDEEFSKYEDILAIKVNQMLISLNHYIEFPRATVQPVPLTSELGQKIYRRSLVYLLGMAFWLEYPNLYLTVEYHVPNGK